MKTTQWLFAILISVACLHANSQKVNAQQVGNTSLGEDGSSAIQIEPNDTPLAEEIRGMFRTTEGKVVRKSTARFTGKVIWFIKPPDTSTIYPAFRANMMDGLKSERTVGAGDTAFVPLFDGSTIRPADITVTPHNNGGRYPSAGFVFRVSHPATDSFTLGGVSYAYTSSDVSTGKPLGELGFSGDFQTNNLSITRIGVAAGLDGVLGTLDDIIYTSGPPTLRLHALFYRGVAHWFEERLPENTGDVERYLAGKQPYFIRTTYVVANAGSATGILYVQPVQPPTPPAPIISDFSGSVSTIVQGGSVTLGWNVQNTATTVTLSGTGTVSPLGTVTVRPSETTLYTLVAVGPGGTVQRSVQVVVTAPPQPPPISLTVSLGASPSSITNGESFLLSWGVSQGASNVTISGIGAVDSVGSRVMKPTETTTYVLDASGPNVIPGRGSITVVVAQPPPSSPSPPPFTIALGVKSGSMVKGAREELVVTSGASLTLFGFVQNRIAGPLTFTDLFYQIGRATNAFQTWVSAGTVVTLASGIVGETEPYPWKAGRADEGSYFRLVGKASGVTLASDWVRIRVVEALKPISLSIQQEGTSVKIQVKAPPGTYYIEDSLQLTGPWLRGGEAITVTEGKVPEILYTRGNRLQGFFRVVHLP